MSLSKQEKRLYRKKMMQIMRGRSVEDLTDEELKKVQVIRGFIDYDTMDDSHPLQKMNFETFTYEDYKRLRKTGYTVKAIKEALGVGGSVWAKWREQNIPVGEKNQYIKRNQKRKKIAVYHDGKILVQGFCEDIGRELGLNPSTIYTYAKRGTTDVKKRTFKYLEEEK